MCRRVLLVVGTHTRLLIGTRSRLLVVGLHSIAEPLCSSLCLFGTILVTVCLMVWDWQVSRSEPLLSCWHDLLFLFLYPTILSSSSFHMLVVWGWGLWTHRVFSFCPGLAQRTPNNNNSRHYRSKLINIIVLLLLLLLKKVGSARLREGDIHPISPKTPAPQYQLLDRKKRNGKTVEDYSRDRAA